MTIAIKHKLENIEAKRRISSAIGELSNSYSTIIKSPTVIWKGNRVSLGVTIKGVAVSGKIEINKEEVTMNFGIPLVAIMFKKKIETEIRTYLQRVLE